VLKDVYTTFWEENGFVHFPAYYDSAITKQLQDWAEELSNLPETHGKWMKYYETTKDGGVKQLCRIEKFIDYHPGFHGLLLEDRQLNDILQHLFGDTPVLFKEKINYKLPGGGGFAPHQDAPAFAMFDQPFHITIMICIDEADMANGCLEFAPGRHKEGLFTQEANGDLAVEEAQRMNWIFLPAQPGDVVIFDSYVPHRSASNTSNRSRRALFGTYNKLQDSDRRDAYYQAKRDSFPPEYERVPGKDYSLNNPFNLGNPIK
jgi:2-aminoethylphosphonate dioxygenase